MLFVGESTYPGRIFKVALDGKVLGDKDRAFENLDRAVYDRDPNILGLRSNPAFENLRHDERYRDLLRKMQLAPPA